MPFSVPRVCQPRNQIRVTALLEFANFGAIFFSWILSGVPAFADSLPLHAAIADPLRLLSCEL